MLSPYKYLWSLLCSSLLQICSSGSMEIVYSWLSFEFAIWISQLWLGFCGFCMQIDLLTKCNTKLPKISNNNRQQGNGLRKKCEPKWWWKWGSVGWEGDWEVQVRGIRQKLIIHKVASGEEDQHHLPDCHCWCQCLPHCDGISLCFVGEILLCSGRPGLDRKSVV